ncbi:hypothetical protein L596_006430 [Steinernema carpocapsae]|nr:hypothetical protein L596_006430 [Steinernema carpocapsae]
MIAIYADTKPATTANGARADGPCKNLIVPHGSNQHKHQTERGGLGFGFSDADLHKYMRCNIKLFDTVYTDTDTDSNNMQKQYFEQITGVVLDKLCDGCEADDPCKTKTKEEMEKSSSGHRKMFMAGIKKKVPPDEQQVWENV